MTNFYVCKLLEDSGGIVRADTIVYGDVEVRPAKSDFKDELAVLNESVTASKLSTNTELASRIGTIIVTDQSEEADLLADEKFIGVLDLLSNEYPLSRLSLTQSGYIKNLDNGDLSPIKFQSFTPSMTFVRQMNEFQNFGFNQWVISQTTELAERYKRSIHWSRNAKWEKNIHVRILYYWFAIEALFKQDANDDVTSFILLFLGFPGGTYSRLVSRNLLQELGKDSAYAKWKKILSGTIDDIRIFRNNSVHSGFRNVDFPLEKLRLYYRAISFGCSRCQGAVKNALLSNIQTVAEFKEYAGIIFESRENLVNDILGNIVHMLDNDHMRSVERTYY